MPLAWAEVTPATGMRDSFMLIESHAQAKGFADAAMAFMAAHAIAPTPQNFVIWYEYHAGRNPDLMRMVEIMLSNNRALDEAVLDDLYQAFFLSTREHQAVRETADRVQKTLRHVVRLVNQAQTDADSYGARLDSASGKVAQDVTALASLFEQLMQETREMAGRAERLGFRLQESASTIRNLERTLDDARREANTDGLTGLANRRAFDMALRELAGEALNSGDELSLLFIDVDYFKKFNDRWGHQVGDEALRLVADTLQQAVRGQDRPARYGGEEFAVLLPGTALNGAAVVGEHIRRAMERRVLELPELEDPITGITLSIGAANYDPGEPLADWLRRADMALYRAKEAGRNRVIAEMAYA